MICWNKEIVNAKINIGKPWATGGFPAQMSFYANCSSIPFNRHCTQLSYKKHDCCPMKKVHDFILPCYVVIIYQFVVNTFSPFTHTRHWVNHMMIASEVTPNGMSNCVTNVPNAKRRHNAKTVCINFLTPCKKTCVWMLYFYHHWWLVHIGL